MREEHVVEGPEEPLVGGALTRDRRRHARRAEADEVPVGQPGDPAADELVEDERLNLSRELGAGASLEVAEVGDLDRRLGEADRRPVHRHSRAPLDRRVHGGHDPLPLRLVHRR